MVISAFFFGFNTLTSRKNDSALPLSNIHANKNVGLCQGSASLHTLSSPSQTWCHTTGHGPTLKLLVAQWANLECTLKVLVHQPDPPNAACQERSFAHRKLLVNGHLPTLRISWWTLQTSGYRISDIFNKLRNSLGGRKRAKGLVQSSQKVQLLANQNRAKKEKRILPIAFDCPTNLDAQITVPLHTGSSYETSIMQGVVVSTLMK